MSELSSLQQLREAAFRVEPAALLAILNGCAATHGDDAIFKEVLGVLKLRSGDVAAGVAVLSKAADSPGHTLDVRSLLILMRAQYAAKEHDIAFEIAQRILRIDPHYEPALRVAARICMLRGDEDQAERFWRAVCDASDEKLEAAFNVARIAQRRGDWETQSLFADIAVSADRNNADALRMAVQARMRTRRFEDFPTLMPMLYRLEPDKALTYLRSLGGLEHSQILGTTLAALRDARLMDDGLAALVAQLVRSWLVAGRRAAGERNEKVAVRLFQAVLLADPAARPALDELIKMSRADLIAMRAALKGGDVVTARNQAEKVLEVNPAQYEASSTLGRLHLEPHPLQAIPHFEKCIALEPEDPWPKLNLAKALERTDNLLDAIRLYDELAGLTGPKVRHYGDEAAKSAASLRRLILRRARDAFRERRLFEAWRLCGPLRPEEMPTVDIKGLETSIRHALVASLRKKHAQHDPDFIREAEAYLERDPDERDVLVPLARALMAMKSFVQAMVYWRRLATLDARDPNFHVQIARCGKALGLRDDAIAATEAALHLDPSLEAALSIQKQLNPQLEATSVLS